MTSTSEPAPGQPRQHTETVTAGQHRYTVRVGGTLSGENTRDPVGYGNYGQAWENNISLRLSNTGDTAVLNPRLAVNGRGRWHSLQGILDEILEDGMTEAGKARAIWEFARRHRYHTTTGDDEVKDTVKMLNVYGYTLCWDEAYTVANLWQAAGLRIRRGIPHGHCTTEVWFDGGWHLLDSDEHLLVLGRDNRTILSETDLAADHDLMKRSHCYGILSAEARASSERAAALFTHTGPHAGERPFIGGHTMDVTLRPGEALEWRWDQCGKYHGYGSAPPRFCNGRHLFAPRLDGGFATWAVSAQNLLPAAPVLSGSAPTGANAAPQPIGLAPEDAQTPSSIVYLIESPYVHVGGNLQLVLARGARSVQVEVARGPSAPREDLSPRAADSQVVPGPPQASAGGQEGLATDGHSWCEVAADLGCGEHWLDLDSHFPNDSPASYRCWVRLSGQLRLQSLEVALDVQMAPLSLPSLTVSDNSVEYTDDTEGGRSVEIIHQWLERDDSQAPVAPRLATPVDGADVPGTRVAFAWDAVPGAVDYHIRVSESPDLKWVVSPVFEKLTSHTPSGGAPRWQAPEEGLLNPGQTYFWQVRARNGEGLWGPWSQTARFTPQAPAVPAEVRCETDWQRRTATLRWQPGSGGTAPARYEVYASDERGFTASREPYPVEVGGEEKTAQFPANLLAQTEARELVVIGGGAPELQAGAPCYFRVVAIDAEGQRSGPSDLAEAPRPFVHSPPPGPVRAGQETTHQMQVLHSRGDLRCVSRGPSRYFAAFRDGDVLDFILDEGPSFIELDGATGHLTFRPEASHVGTHTVTVRVHNGQGGMDVQGFDLVVIA